MPSEQPTRHDESWSEEQAWYLKRIYSQNGIVDDSKPEEKVELLNKILGTTDTDFNVADVNMKIKFLETELLKRGGLYNPPSYY